MEGDRSWMYGPRYVEKKVNPVFVNGVEEFFNYAFVIPNNVDKQNRIKCQCANCGCTRWWDRYTIEKHLLKSDFRLYYETWTMHGECANVRLGEHSQTVVEETVIEDMATLFREGEKGTDKYNQDMSAKYRSDEALWPSFDEDIWYANTDNNAHGDNYGLGALGKTRSMYRPGGSWASSSQSRVESQSHSYTSGPPPLKQEDINAISGQVLGIIQPQLNQFMEFMEEMRRTMAGSSSHQDGIQFLGMLESNKGIHKKFSYILTGRFLHLDTHDDNGDDLEDD